MERMGEVHHPIIITDNRSALTTGNHFTVLQAEAAKIPKRTDFLVLPFRHMGLTGILYHSEIVLLCDQHNLIHLAHASSNMNRENGMGIPIDFFFDFFRIHEPGLGIYIGKNG
ncbi:hypothetical protein ES708_26314 [subsurface metagenome]